MLATAPVFTVVIPVHNRATLVGRAIRSVFAQTFQDFELIVVDDGSTDATADEVNRHSDPRLSYVRQNHQGVGAARNHGAGRARGRFITFLDSDDEALPEWLGTLAEMMNRDGTAIACCAAVAVEPGGAAGRRFDVHDLGPAFANQVGLFLAGTFALTRELFLHSGGYVVGLRGCENTELALRLIPLAVSQATAIRATPERLIRLHRDTTQLRRGDERVLEGAVYCLVQHRTALRQDARVYATYLAIAGVTAAKLNRHGIARSYLLKAVRVQPNHLRHWIRLALALVPVVGLRVWSMREHQC